MSGKFGRHDTKLKVLHKKCVAKSGLLTLRYSHLKFSVWMGCGFLLSIYIWLAQKWGSEADYTTERVGHSYASNAAASESVGKGSGGRLPGSIVFAFSYCDWFYFTVSFAHASHSTLIRPSRKGYRTKRRRSCAFKSKNWKKSWKKRSRKWQQKKQRFTDAVSLY